MTGSIIVAALNTSSLKGDLNDNGRIDIGDASKIAYFLVGKVSEL